MSEYPTIYNDKVVKSRKEYKCCNCRNKIEKGDLYTRITGKWDGKFETFTSCNDCMKIMDNPTSWDKNMDSLSYPSLGDLKEWLADYIYQDYTEKQAANDLAKLYSIPLGHAKSLFNKGNKS